jgi:hypothetical protein
MVLRIVALLGKVDLVVHPIMAPSEAGVVQYSLDPSPAWKIQSCDCKERRIGKV